MLHIQSNNIEQELIAFVQSWFNLIAQGHINEACNQLDKPNCYGIKWNAKKIQVLISDEFSPDTLFGSSHPEGVAFSSVSQTSGKFSADVLKFDDGSGYTVEHDVPLNGEWSDLTAQFEFVGEFPEFEVILHDLHVL